MLIRFRISIHLVVNHKPKISLSLFKCQDSLSVWRQSRTRLQSPERDVHLQRYPEWHFTTLTWSTWFFVVVVFFPNFSLFQKMSNYVTACDFLVKINHKKETNLNWRNLIWYIYHFISGNNAIIDWPSWLGGSYPGSWYPLMLLSAPPSPVL